MYCHEQGYQLAENELWSTSISCANELVDTLMVYYDISIAPMFKVFIQSIKAVNRAAFLINGKASF